MPDKSINSHLCSGKNPQIELAGEGKSHLIDSTSTHWPKQCVVHQTRDDPYCTYWWISTSYFASQRGGQGEICVFYWVMVYISQLMELANHNKSSNSVNNEPFMNSNVHSWIHWKSFLFPWDAHWIYARGCFNYFMLVLKQAKALCSQPLNSGKGFIEN